MNKSRSIIKKITCPNSDGTDDPVIGISGCLVIGHHSDSTRSTSSNFQSNQNGTLEFRDTQNNKMFITAPESDDFNVQYKPLIHVMPNKPIRTVIKELYAYIDNYVKGLDIKQSVDVATTQNIDLQLDVRSMTIDTICYPAQPFNRVLVKDQTDKKENGIYEVSGNKLVRAGDFTNSTDTVEGVTVPEDFEGFVTPGSFTFVEQGVINRYRGYAVTKTNHSQDDRLRINTDEINFTQFTGIQPLKEGHGLTVDRINNIIKVNMDISFNDVSLNRIGYLDLSSNKNIDVNAHLIPLENENRKKYNLGSRDSSWNEIYGETLLAGFIIVREIDASSINVTDLSAVDISASTLNVTDISAVDISASTLSVTDISAVDISASTLFVTDISAVDISAIKINTSILNADDIDSVTLKGKNLESLNDPSNNISIKGSLIPKLDIKDISNVTQFKLGNSENIWQESYIRDISVNSIGALFGNDASKNIIINGNLIPPPFSFRDPSNNLNSLFSLGAPNNRWKSLYVSDKTIFIGDSSLGIQTQKVVQEDGSVKRTIELVFVPESSTNKDNNADGSGNQTSTSTSTPQPSISIAKGEFVEKTEITIGPSGETIEVPVLQPIEESFGAADLVDLADVDISKNLLVDGSTIIYDISNEKFIMGPSEYVNSSQQNFYNIQTQQPAMFGEGDESKLDSATALIDWSYNKIIALDPYPNGKRMFNSNSYGKKKNKSIPYIDNLQIDISGSTNDSFSGSNPGTSGWLSYKNIQIPDNHDYYSDEYSFVNNVGETITLPYSKFKIFKTIDTDPIKNTNIISNILSQTNKDPSSNPTFSFDLRVYGNNDASNNSSDEEIEKRALIFRNLFFRAAQPPSITHFGQTSLFSDNKVQLNQTVNVTESEKDNINSAAKIIKAKVNYSLSETKVASYLFSQQSITNINGTKEYTINPPKGNNETMDLLINNIYNNNSITEIKYASQYELDIVASNNLIDTFSNNLRVTTGFTKLYDSSLSRFFDKMQFTRNSFTPISFISKVNGVQNFTVTDNRYAYINLWKNNGNPTSIAGYQIGFGSNFNGSANRNGTFEVTNPSAVVSDTNGFGKYIQDKRDLVTILIKVKKPDENNFVEKVKIEYCGFSLIFSTYGNYGVVVTDLVSYGPRSSNDIRSSPNGGAFRFVDVNNGTFCKDINQNSKPKSGLRLEGSIRLQAHRSGGSYTDIFKSYIGGPNKNRYIYEVEIERSNDVSGNLSRHKDNTDQIFYYVDELEGFPILDPTNGEITTTINQDGLIYTMGIPSVVDFKLNFVTRKYKNINSKYGYIPIHGKVVSFKGLSQTYGSSGPSNADYIISQGDIVDDVSNAGNYSLSESDILSITNNYYNNISHSMSRNESNKSNKLILTESLYSMNTFQYRAWPNTTNNYKGINVLTNISVKHHFDSSSYYIVGSSNAKRIFSRNISDSQWENIFEIKSNHFDKLNKKEILDLKNESTSLRALNNHTRIIEAGTLLYYSGAFQSPSTVDYPVITNTNYDFDNRRANVANSDGATDYVANQVDFGLAYNNTKYKWIVFKFDKSDITKVNNLDVLDLSYPNGVLNAYLSAYVINKIKSNDGKAITFVMTSTDIGIGCLSTAFAPLNTWYDKSLPSSYKNLDNLRTNAQFGALVEETSTGKWGAFINKKESGDQKIYVFVGLDNNHNFLT